MQSYINLDILADLLARKPFGRARKRHKRIALGKMCYLCTTKKTTETKKNEKYETVENRIAFGGHNAWGGRGLGYATRLHDGETA